jgi:hypothetical protein
VEKRLQKVENYQALVGKCGEFYGAHPFVLKYWHAKANTSTKEAQARTRAWLSKAHEHKKRSEHIAAPPY